MRRFVLLVLFAVAGCTPGAPPAGGGRTSAATIIDVSLTSATVVATPFGSSSGYAPAVTTVALGTTVQFVNRDSFAHTATALGASGAFPDVPSFGASALAAFGDRLSGGWSTGTLAAGASSPLLAADLPGTYLYGCFYHYGAPMRAAIVVR